MMINDRATPMVASEKEDGSSASDEPSISSSSDDTPAEHKQLLENANGKTVFERLRSLIPFRRNASLRQDLEVVLEKGDADLTFSPEERAMLQNILRLREVRADDIMIPRVDIDAVDVSITIGELLFLFEDARHSRMPVYRDTLDDPLGMVHVKDVMGYVMAQAEKNPENAVNEHGQLRNDVVDYDLTSVDLRVPLSEVELLRPVLFVPPSMPASDIFARMQTARSQMALVIDEYGGTDGLLSMEDVVEAIVGDIEDEHDDDEGPNIISERTGRWIADAKIPLAELSETLGISVDIEMEDEDVATLGGLVFTKLGRVPVRGEVVKAIDDYDLEIVDVDPRRIRRVRIVETKNQSKRRRGRERSAGGVSQAGGDVPGSNTPLDASQENSDS